jgi:hypothetical protein
MKRPEQPGDEKPSKTPEKLDQITQTSPAKLINNEKASSEPPAVNEPLLSVTPPTTVKQAKHFGKNSSLEVNEHPVGLYVKDVFDVGNTSNTSTLKHHSSSHSRPNSSSKQRSVSAERSNPDSISGSIEMMNSSYNHHDTSSPVNLPIKLESPNLNLSAGRYLMGTNPTNNNRPRYVYPSI